MEIEEIEQLVSIVRGARISELTVSTDGSSVRLRKPLPKAQPSTPHRHPAARTEAAGSVTVASDSSDAAEVFVDAPMVGIFHSAGNAIAKGIAVKAGQSVGAIESMKLMNDVISDHDGVIADVLVEDGMPVEYGQPLFRLDAG